MSTNNTRKIVLLAVLIVSATMSGCLEYTEETEYGSVTVKPLIDQTVEHINMYEDDMHITGKIVTTNGSSYCNLRYEIDGYENSVHITGIGTYQGNPDDMDFDKNVYYNIRYEINEYEDGMHITGIGTYQGTGFNENNIQLTCNVDGYIDGNPVTGTIMMHGNNDPIYNLRCDIDEYEDGMHITGVMTLSGSDKDKWYVDYDINGYTEGYPVTGTMIGYTSYVHTTMTVHTPYGDVTKTTITNM
jgi:hypothetical protein